MDADEVIPDGVERDHVGVVLELLRESVGQPREAAHVHSHREVLALHIARRNVLGIGPTLDRGLEVKRFQTEILPATRPD